MLNRNDNPTDSLALLFLPASMPVFFSRRFFDPVMSDRDVCPICTVRVHLAIRRRSLGSNRGMKGASELETWLTSGQLKESFCNVVDGKEEMSSEHNCGFGFLNSQTLRQNRGSGKSEMSDSDDSHQSGHEYPDSVWSWSARLKGQRPLCVGRCIRDTSSKRRRDCLWLFVRVVLC